MTSTDPSQPLSVSQLGEIRRHHSDKFSFKCEGCRLLEQVDYLQTQLAASEAALRENDDVILAAMELADTIFVNQGGLFAGAARLMLQAPAQRLIDALSKSRRHSQIRAALGAAAQDGGEKPRSPYHFQSTCGVCGVEIGGDGDVCSRCASHPGAGGEGVSGE